MPIDPSLLFTAALRSSVAALPMVGRRTTEAVRWRHAFASASALSMRADYEQFLTELSIADARALEGYLKSPAFSKVMLECVICSVSGYKEYQLSHIRETMRASLKSRGFRASETPLAADVLMDVAYRAALTTVREVKSTLSSERAARIAAQAANVMALNDRVVRRLEDHNRLEELVQSIGQASAQIYGKLDLPSVISSASANWQDLYVEPTFTIESENEASAAAGESVQLDELLGATLRLVVLGDPGAGKSTMVEKLAWSMATSIESSIQELERIAPLVLIVRNMAVDLGRRKHDLLHYLVNACRAPLNVDASRDQVEQLLISGQCVIIVDGLDELTDTSLRRDFQRLLETFVLRYPLASIIVTSRKIGYSEAPLDPRLFDIAWIRPFGDNEVEDYASRWFALQGRSELTPGFVKEASVTGDLTGNPLVLSLLCVLYRTGGSLPRNLPEVYRRCAELLFRAWDESRGIPIPPGFDAFSRRAIQRIAWRLFTSASRSKTIKRGELTRFLARDVLRESFQSEEEAERAATAFVSFCAGRAWVLTDLGLADDEPVYGFTHRTFLEFFCANHLVRSSKSAEELWNKIEVRIDDQSWIFVRMIAMQLFDEDRENGADEVLSLAVRALRGGPSGRMAGISQFCGDALSAVAPSNNTIQEIVEAFASIAASASLSIRWRDRTPIVVDKGLVQVTRQSLDENVRRIDHHLDVALSSLNRQDPDLAALLRVGIRQARVARALSAEPVYELHKGENVIIQSFVNRVVSPRREDIDRFGPTVLFSGPTFDGQPIAEPAVIGDIERLCRASAVTSSQRRVLRGYLRSIYPAVMAMFAESHEQPGLDEESAGAFGFPRIEHAGSRLDFTGVDLMKLSQLKEQIDVAWALILCTVESASTEDPEYVLAFTRCLRRLAGSNDLTLVMSGLNLHPSLQAATLELAPDA